MMDKKDLTYYKTIGLIQLAISKAKTLEEALNKGIEILIEKCGIQHTVVWLYDNGNDVLRPYYSMCSTDITFKQYPVGEGIPGKVYRDESTISYLNYQAGTDSDFEELFQNIQIGSEICVLLAGQNNKLGCVQIINDREFGALSSEYADMIEIMISMIGIYIEDNEDIVIPWKLSNPIIQVRNLQKEFINGDSVTKVLRGVNMDIYEGEFVVLLGESGCGKTTLLNIIGGLESATSGEVIFKGDVITDKSQNELSKYRRDHIGFIFQSYNLMPNLTAKRNVDLIAEMVSEPMDSVEALRLVNLEDKAGNFPAQLSGGQQQRVSIARAIVKKPCVIMADEPTAALDYETSIEVLSIMENIVKQGTTLLMVTHNTEITKMANRVIKLRAGVPYKVTINRHPVKATELVW